jgi:hypothetical protein
VLRDDLLGAVQLDDQLLGPAAQVRLVLVLDADTQVAEDVVDQAGHQRTLAVVPRVELDLRDPAVVEIVGAVVGGRAETRDPIADPLHEEALSGAPGAEHADRQGCVGRARGDELGEGLHLAVDVVSGCGSGLGENDRPLVMVVAATPRSARWRCNHRHNGVVPAVMAASIEEKVSRQGMTVLVSMSAQSSDRAPRR